MFIKHVLNFKSTQVEDFVFPLQWSSPRKACQWKRGRNWVPVKQDRVAELTLVTHSFLTRWLLCPTHRITAPRPGCSIRVMKQEPRGAAQFLDEAVTLADTNAQKDSARWSISLTLLFLWRWCKIGNVFVLQNPPAMQKTPVWFLGWEDLLEKG